MDLGFPLCVTQLHHQQKKKEKKKNSSSNPKSNTLIFFTPEGCFFHHHRRCHRHRRQEHNQSPPSSEKSIFSLKNLINFPISLFCVCISNWINPEKTGPSILEFQKHEPMRGSDCWFFDFYKGKRKIFHDEKLKVKSRIGFFVF